MNAAHTNSETYLATNIRRVCRTPINAAAPFLHKDAC